MWDSMLEILEEKLLRVLKSRCSMTILICIVTCPGVILFICGPRVMLARV